MFVLLSAEQGCHTMVQPHPVTIRSHFGVVLAASRSRCSCGRLPTFAVFGFLGFPASLPLPLSPMVMPFFLAPGWQPLESGGTFRRLAHYRGAMLSPPPSKCPSQLC